MNRPEEIPCRLCATPMRMHSTQLCDYCWELQTRLRDFERWTKTREGYFALREVRASITRILLANDMLQEGALD